MNREKDHIVILPEDRANEEIINGFIQNLNIVNDRAVKVERPIGGWVKTLDKFNDDHAPKMRKYLNRLVVLVIDFDRDEHRLEHMTAKIPDDLKDRVFVVGTFSNPEDLRTVVKQSFEDIGDSLADDCFNETDKLWSHDLLKHNKDELSRMTIPVKSLIFGSGSSSSCK